VQGVVAMKPVHGIILGRHGTRSNAFQRTGAGLD
jgi:hypothetical protein